MLGEAVALLNECESSGKKPSGGGDLFKKSIDRILIVHPVQLIPFINSLIANITSLAESH